MAALPPEVFWNSNIMYREFRGALAENAILQSLIPQLQVQPRYWVSNATAEVDFVIQYGADVLPVEVKSGTNTSGKSLSVYIKKYIPAYSIIYSEKELEYRDGVLRIPHFMADWTVKLLNLLK